ncbi:VCBS domain-containing protein [Rhodobacteraceae bacterium M382]|nr:VCBS domain-containing protein [Rhodobacteraceae bacterium M382]
MAAPVITSIVPSITTLVEGETSFSLTIQFDQGLDSAVTPSISLDPALAATLGVPTGIAFSTTTTADDTVVVTYVVTDANLELADVDVSVSGAQNLSAEVISPTVITDVFSVDMAVETPAAPDLTPSSDSGSSTSDNITFFQTPSLNVSLVSEVGATVQLLRSPAGAGTYTLVGSETVTSGNAGSIVQFQDNGQVLSDGVYDYITRVTDAAGNQSSSSILSVTVDTQVVAPGNIQMVAADDSGLSNSDAVTSEGAPDFTIDLGASAKIGDVIELLDNGSVVASVTLTSDGAQTVTFENVPLNEAAHVMTARASDTTGNSAVGIASLDVVIDQSNPDTPTLSVPGSETTTSDIAISLNGLTGGVASGTVTLSDGSASETYTFTDAEISGGSVALTEEDLSGSGLSLADGTITVSAVVMDLAGNSSTAINQSFVLDSTADELNDLSVTFNGTATDGFINASEAGAAGVNIIVDGIDGDIVGPVDIVLTSDGGGTATISNVTNGTHAIAPAALALLNDGTLTATVVVSDDANNTKTVTDNAVLDTGLPTVTVTSSITGTANAADGDVTFTIEFDEDVSGFDTSDVTVANGTKGSFTAVDGNTYTLVVTPDAALEGNVTVDVSTSGVVDAAGNVATAPAQFVQAVDNIAPSITSVSVSDATVGGDDVSGTVTIDVTYDSNMDQSVDPSIAFSSPVDTTLGLNAGMSGWLDATTYRAVYDVLDGDVDVQDVDFTVTGAQDLAANPQALQSFDENIDIDTVNPTVTISDDTNGVSNSTSGDVTFTFEFTEGVTGFSASNVTVTNGTKGSFVPVDSNTYTLVVTPQAGVSGDISVELNTAGVVDAQQNVAVTPAVYTQPIDTVVPTVTGISVTPSSVNEDTASIDIVVTFSEAMDQAGGQEPVVSLSPAPAGLSLGAGVWTSGGTVFTVTATHTDSDEAVADIDVTVTGGQDVNGNAHVSTNEVDAITVDSVAPVAMITMDSAALNAGADSATVTISFSEAVTGLEISDFTVPNGALSALATADNVTWTATYTANSGVDSATNQIELTAGTVLDAAGNDNAVASGPSFAIDTVVPTVTGISVTPSSVNEDTASIDIVVTFSEAMDQAGGQEPVVSLSPAPAGLSLGAGVWTSGGTVFTVTATHTDSDEAVSDIDVTVTGGQDVNGNAHVSTNEVDAISVDSVAPVAMITMDSAALNAGADSATVTISFSEAVTGLEISDFTVPNGALSALATADGGVTWTATYTANSGVDSATNQIELTAGTVLDAAGNDNAVASGPSFAIDTVVPTVTGISVTPSSVNEDTASIDIVVTFSEAMDQAGGQEPVVSLSPAPAGLSLGAGVWTSGGTVFTVTATHTDSDEAVSDIDVTVTGGQDVNGNAHVSTNEVDAISVDSVAPVAMITMDSAALNAGADSATVTISFSEAVTGLEISDFTVPNGALSALATADGGVTWTATYTANSGVDSATNQIELTAGTVLDAAGNDNAVASGPSFAIDTDVPVAPIITEIFDDTFVPAGATTSNDPRPTIRGTGEIGATVTVYVAEGIGGTPSALAETAVVDGSGNWEITPTTDIVSSLTGTYELFFTASQTDPAANTSPVSSSVQLDLDFAPEITGYTDGGNPVPSPDQTVAERDDGAVDENAGDIITTGRILFEDAPTSQVMGLSITPPVGGIGVLSASVVDTTETDSSGQIEWTYTVSAAELDYLGADDTLNFDYTLVLVDGSDQSDPIDITITITGTNDAPVVSLTQPVAVNEDADASAQALSVSGNIMVTDVDAGRTVPTAQSADADALTLTLAGAATAKLNGADYTGPNDISALTQAVNLTLTTTAATATGSAQSFAFSYSATGNIDWLNNGETLTLTFVVNVADGTDTVPQEVNITITGSNDAPVVTVDTDTATDDSVAATGNVLSNDSDADGSDVLAVATAAASGGSATAVTTGTVITGTFGTLTISDDGGYSYVVTDESLDDTDTVQDVFDLGVSDGTATVASTLTVAITGSNDAPVVTVDTDTATDDSVAATGNVLSNDSDADGSDVLAVATAAAAGDSATAVTTGTVITGTYGTLTISDDGGYSYVVTDESLDDTDTVQDVFDLGVSDGTATVASTLTIAITGSNDAPVVTVDTDTATDDSVAATGNVLSNDSDADGSDVLAVATAAASGDSATAVTTGTVITGTYGTLTISDDGSYSYVVTDESLDDTDTVQDVFDLGVSDGTATVASTLTIAITGSNDAPVVTVDTDTATDDSVAATGNVLSNDSDADGSDVLAVATAAASGGSATAVTTGTVITGTYGTLTISDDGGYSYVVTDESLDDTDTVQDVFDLGVSDGTATVASTLTIAITGSNDAPVVTVDTDTATDDSVAATGNVLSNDSDADGSDVLAVATAAASGGSATAVTTGTVITGTFGTLTISDDGGYSYVVTDESLDDTDTVQDVFDLGVSDGTATVASTLTVAITGSNDAPVVTVDTDTATDDSVAATGNVLSNDSDADGSDVLAVATAAAAGDSATAVTTGTVITGMYGTLTISDDGSYSYVVTDESLDDTDTVQDVFDLGVSDGTATVASTLTIAITGSNDAPVVTVDTDTATDDSVAATGNVLSNDSDADGSDVLAVATAAASGGSATAVTTGTVITGMYGTLTISDDGSYSYVVTDESLDDTDTVQDVFDLGVSDGTATVASTLTIAITGSNDAPVVTVDTDTATDDSVAATGNVLSNDSDADGSDVLAVATAAASGDSATAVTTGTVITGTYGTLTISDDGGYSYVVTDESLDDTDTVQDVFDLGVSDGTATVASTLTIAITGSNDAPVVTVDTDTATDDSVAATGNVLSNDSDADGSDVLAVATAAVSGGSATAVTTGTVITGMYGTLTISDDGGYSYVVTDESLDDTDAVQDVFDLGVSDGTATVASTLTIAIAGSEDLATISGDFVDTISEAGVDGSNMAVSATTASGTLTVTDLDAGENLLKEKTESGDNAYGVFSVNANGSWSYALTDPEVSGVQELAVGESVTDTITVESLDGSASQLITVTIQGTNDAPFIVGTSDLSGDVVDGGVLTASGTINFNDHEIADNHTILVAPATTGYVGAFASSVTALAVGSTASGSITWTLTVGASEIQGLSEGQEIVQYYDVAITDPHGGQVQEQIAITLMGTNDLPVISATTSPAAISEDVDASAQTIAANGMLEASDVDIGESVQGQGNAPDTISASVIGDAAVTYTGTGTLPDVSALAANANLAFSTAPQVSTGAAQTFAFSYNATGDLDFLALGEMLELTYTVQISDNHGGVVTDTVTVTITGTNDAPTAVADTGSAVENGGTILVDLTGNDTDPDSADDLEIVSIDTTGTLGTVAINLDNDTVTYDPNGQFEALAIGEMATDTFTYTISDGNGVTSTETVTITITGSNDAPVVTVDTDTATDDSVAATGNVLSNDSDADGSDVLAVATAAASGDSATAVTTGTVITGTYGTLTISDDGGYSYVVTDESLDDTDAVQDVFDLGVSDGTATVASTLTISVSGSNDAPVVTVDTDTATDDSVAATGNVLSNDSDADGSDVLAVATAAVSGGSATVVTTGTVITGTYGTLTISDDGGYSYVVTDESLDDTDAVQDVFDLGVSDGTATVASTLTIAITGSNDAPVVTVDTDTATDDSVAATGNVLSNDSDADGSDVLAVATAAAAGDSATAVTTGTVITGTYGTLTISDDGGYSYVVTDESLDDTDTVQDVFDLGVSDGTATVASTLTIAITGSNDAPVVTVDTDTATDDSVAATGNVLSNDSDADGSDVLAVATAAASGDSATAVTTGTVITGTFGTLTISDDGSYSYVVTDESLDDTDTVQDVFDLGVSDGTATVASTLTIAITGSNDAPVVTVDTDTATDDSVAATGNVLSNDSDADGSDVLAVATAAASGDSATAVTTGTVITGTYGTLTISDDGGYSYVVTDESLDDTDTVQDVFDLGVSDGTATVASTLTIAITGSNDAPVVTVDTDTATDDSVAATGNVLSNDSDADGSDVLAVATAAASGGSATAVTTGTVITGTFGTLTISDDGSYSYVVTDESLDDTDTVQDVFDLGVSDGTATVASTLTIAITGSNDAPVVTVDTDTATDDSVAATGNVLSNDSDADGSDVLAVATAAVSGDSATAVTTGTVITGTYGTLTISDDGGYSYVVTDESLDDTDTVQDVFDLGVSDGTATVASTLTIAITGSNDAPVVTVDTDTATDDSVAATGNVLSNDSDADGSDVLAVATAAASGDSATAVTTGTVITGTYGTLTISDDGGYSYVVTDESLDDTDTVQDVFDLGVSDGTATVASTLTIAITGSNDAPTFVFAPTVLPLSDTPNDDTFATIDGAVVVDDIDTGDFPALSLDGGSSTLEAGFTHESIGQFGTLYFNSTNGAFRFAPNDAAIEGLDDAETGSDVFTITVTDSQLATAQQAITINLTGTNDVPVIVADVSAATEDGATITGDLSSNDVDRDGEALSYTLDAPVSGFVLSSDGSWSFDPSHADYQYLARDQMVTVVVNYSATDGTVADSGTLSITLTGTNDAPNAVLDTVTVVEGQSVGGDLSTNDDPVDDGSVLTYTLNAPVDGLTVNTDGTFTFDASHATYDSLGAGQTTVVVASQRVEDQDGAFDNETLLVTVNGVNDAAVITGDDTGSVTENAEVAATGNLDHTDVDANNANDAWSTTVVTQGIYGLLTITGSGSWTYVLDEANPTVDALNASMSLTDTITVETTDGTQETIQITINGGNDAPTVSAGVTGGAGEDDAGFTIDLLSNASDVDTGDTLNVAGLNLVGGDDRGVSVVGNSLDVDPSAYNHLAAGETEIISYSFVVQDGKGGSVAHTATITITGSNDAPVVTVDTDTATDDSVAATGNVLSNDSDADGSDVLAVATAAASGGSATAVTTGTVITGTFGTLTISDDGGYSYVVTDESLDDTDTVQDVFDLGVSDGTATVASTLTVAITGSNDAPVVTVDTDTATDDSVAATGNVLSNDSDADGSDVLAVATAAASGDSATAVTTGTVITGTYGTLTISDDGGYSYVVTDESLDDTDTVQDVFDLGVSDGTATVASTLTIAITGSNDAPVVTVDTDTATDDSVAATGNVLSNDSDADGSDVLAVATAAVSGGSATAVTTGTVITGMYGTLTISDDGSYSYVVTDESLDDTDAVQDVFDLGVSDGTATVASTLTVAITGSNDAPVVTVDTDTATDDSVAATGNVLSNDSDADGSDVLAVATAAAAGDSATAVTTGTVITGMYGTLTISDDGSYSYVVTDESLDDTDTVQDVFDLGVSDGTATVASTLTIAITGSNDAPVVTVDTDTATDDSVAATGNVLSNDSDADGSDVLAVATAAASGGSATAVTTGTVITGTFGTLTISDDGSYSYVVTDESLDDTDTVQDVFDLGVSDGTATVASTLTIAITGSNDAPVVTVDTDTATDDSVAATGNVLSNDSDADGSDVLAVATAAASGDSATAVTTGTVITGTYGTLTISDDGGYSYVVTDESLDDTDTVQDVFDLGVSDGTATVASTLTIAITGSNDAPVVTVDTDTATDDSVAATGNVLSNDSDADGSDVLAVATAAASGGSATAVTTGTVITGTFGTLTISDDGGYSYVVTDESLDDTDTVQDVFDLGVSDGTATVASTLTVAITGSNDAPVVTVDTDTATDDSVAATGNVLSNDSDADGSDVLAVATAAAAGDSATAVTTGTVITGMYGTLTISDDGSYSYVVTDESLDDTDTVQDVFDLGVSDGTATVASTLTIAITGSNDAPVVTVDTDTATDDSVAATGNVLSNDSDADGSDVLAVATAAASGGSATAVTTGTVITGTFGTLTISDDGSYSYVVTDESLDDTDTVQDVFDLGVSDGTATVASTLTIAITGSNDAPVVTVDTDTATDDSVAATGNVLSNDSDADGSDVLAVATAAAAGDSATAVTTGTVITGTYGTLTISDDGGYSYVVTDESLDDTDTVQDVFDLGVSDGTATVASTLTIAITGSNDAPVVTVDTDTATDDSVAATGNVLSNDSDADGSDVLAVATAAASGDSATAVTTGTVITGTYGTLTISDDGSYSYVVTDESLDDTDTVQDVFDLGVSDGTATVASTLTIAITGSNDAPVVTVDTDTATDDSVAATGNVLSNDSDADGSDVLAVATAAASGGSATAVTTGTVITGTYGTLTISDDGGYSYVVTDESLDDTDTVQDVFDLGVSDGTATVASTLTIAITGSNDAPVVTVDTDTATDDSVAATGNVLSNDSDADGSDVLAVATAAASGGSATAVTTGTVITGTFGTLTISDDGGYSYVVTDESLDDTDTVQDVFDLGVSDGTATVASTLTVAITGSNDAPVVTVDTDTATDDSVAATGNVLSNDSDADGSDVLAVATAAAAGDSATAVTTGTVITGMYGTLTISDDGSYSYVVTDESLDDTDTVQDVFDLGVSDGTATVASTLTIAITGSNDAPVVTVDTDTATDDSVAATGNVLSNDSDADGSDVLAVATAAASGGSATAVTTGTVITGTFGTLTISDDGSYSYVVTDESLDDTDTVQDVFDLGVSDGTATVASTLTIAITGSNDAPVVTVDTDTATDDSVAATGNVLSNDSDADGSDVLAVATAAAAGDSATAVTTGTVITGTYGTLTISDDGGYSYVVTDESLDDTDTVQDVFDLGVSDGTATVASTLTIAITGSNDAPVVTVDTDTATDDSVAATGNVLSNDSDADGSDVLAVATAAASGDSATAVTTGTVITGTYGTLTISDDGSYSYVVTDESLDDTDTVQDVFDLGVSDGTATVASTLTIAITGSNDAPVVTVDTDTATDDSVAATGNVLSNDSDADGSDVLAVATAAASGGSATAVTTGTVITGTFGTLTISDDGGYSYVVTDESLDDTDAVQDVFDLGVSDGTATVASTLTIAITGSNDAPVVTVDTDTATDDSVAATGNVLSNDSDADGSDVLAVATAAAAGDSATAVTTGTVITGTYGTLTISDDGGYSYVVTDESLDDTDTVQDVFDLGVSDGTATVASTLTIAITGSNDAPVVTVDTDTATDDSVAATGNVLSNDSDADGSDVLAVATAAASGDSATVVTTGTVITGMYGTLTISDDGSYSYVVTDESLDDTDTVQDVFDLGVSDGTATVASTLTISVSGSNDAPVVVVGAAGQQVAGLPYVLGTGDISASDVDTGDVLTYTVTPVTGGGLQVNGVASTSFTQAQLEAGQVAVLYDGGSNLSPIFDVSVSDGTDSVSATASFQVDFSPTSFTLVPEQAETDNYGNRFGAALSPTGVVSGSFDAPGNETVLRFDGFDIDFADEVRLLVNGSEVGFLGVGVDNGVQAYEFVISDTLVNPTGNVVQFQQMLNPDFKWGVTNIVLDSRVRLTEDVLETGEFGNNFNGSSDADGIVTAVFQGLGKDATLFFNAFDIDSGGEVEVLLNGTSLGFLDKGLDNGLSANEFQIDLSDQMVGDNVVQFIQRQQSTYTWGVTDLVITERSAVDFNLEREALEIGKFGNNFGGSTDADGVVTGSFIGSGEDLVLGFSAFDIDTATELQVAVNGVDLGPVAPTSNDGTAFYQFRIDSSALLSGENLVTFTQADNPAYKWGVTDISIQSIDAELTQGTTETGKWGNNYAGRTEADASAVFSFAGSTKDLSVDLTGFDIDTNNEVEIFLNGQSLGFLDQGTNGGNSSHSVFLSSDIQMSGENTLSFVQEDNPNYQWGVTDLLLSEHVDAVLTADVTDTGSFGNNFNGTNTPDAELLMTFMGGVDDFELTFNAFDIDTDNEVEVFLNGNSLGRLDAGVDQGLSAYQFDIAQADQLAGTNMLTFVQLQNPNFVWGVTDILLQTAMLPDEPITIE